LNEADVKSVKPRSADDPVAASFSVPQNALRAGDTFEVSVDFEIALSYEIQDRNSLPPAVSTLIELNLPAGFEAIEDWSDPTSFRSELPDSHMVYAGKATFTRKVRIGNAVAPGQYALSCLFRYQACNARQCLRPVESRLAVTLTIQAGWDRDKKTLAEFQDVREIQQGDRCLAPVERPSPYYWVTKVMYPRYKTEGLPCGLSIVARLNVNFPWCKTGGLFSIRSF